jgi:hypothetical protein
MVKKHLVITTTADLSLELFKPFSDIVLLDKEPVTYTGSRYRNVYIRSHFSKPATLPQNFRTGIETLVQGTKSTNSEVSFIDGMDTVDKIIAFEDKWLQYGLFKEFMPTTSLVDGSVVTNFNHPIFKKRLSSRGSGVTLNAKEVTEPYEEWIVQESIAIKEELRVYVIHGGVYPEAVIRQSKTSQQKIKAVAVRALASDEIDFSARIYESFPDLDFIGLDIARTSEGALKLIEVNRSPDFLIFSELSGVNLASLLYSERREEAK